MFMIRPKFLWINKINYFILPLSSVMALFLFDLFPCYVCSFFCYVFYYPYFLETDFCLPNQILYQHHILLCLIQCLLLVFVCCSLLVKQFNNMTLLLATIYHLSVILFEFLYLEYLILHTYFSVSFLQHLQNVKSLLYSWDLCIKYQIFICLWFSAEEIEMMYYFISFKNRIFLKRL